MEIKVKLNGSNFPLVINIPMDKRKVACLKSKNSTSKTKLEVAKLKGDTATYNSILDGIRSKFVDVITTDAPFAGIFPAVCYPVSVIDVGGPLSELEETEWVKIGEDGNLLK